MVNAAVDMQPGGGLELSQQATGPTGTSALTPSGSRIGPRWHVVASHAHAEFRALEHLTQQGYNAFLPRHTVKRRSRVVWSLWREVELPLFPGYLFVQLAPSDQWGPICHTPGVFRLILNSERIPAVVPAGLVEALQATEDARRVVTADEGSWAPGTPCRVASGAFSGHDAVVVGRRDGGVLVAMMMFGAVREVVVSADCLMGRE